MHGRHAAMAGPQQVRQMALLAVMWLCMLGQDMALQSVCSWESAHKLTVPAATCGVCIIDCRPTALGQHPYFRVRSSASHGLNTGSLNVNDLQLSTVQTLQCTTCSGRHLCNSRNHVHMRCPLPDTKPAAADAAGAAQPWPLPAQAVPFFFSRCAALLNLPLAASSSGSNTT